MSELIICKKRSLYLKVAITTKYGEFFELFLLPVKINNQLVSVRNIYVASDLAFLVILVGKEHSSPKWCMKCQLQSSLWL